MLLFLLACGVTEANFPDRYAAEACSRYEECYQAEFEVMYDDAGECQDDLLGFLDYLEACDFDRAAAHDCLAEVRDAHCADLFESDMGSACGEVYTNCSED